MQREEKFYGNYVGIVIQNNDPDQYGRVKVFIPNLSPTAYNKWISEKNNKKISSLLGSNGSKELSDILNELKSKLPWAECAAPLVGESSSGRFNNFNLFGTKSDSNFFQTTFSTVTAVSSQNIGNSPSSLYNTEILNDGFDKASNNINRPNPLSYNYKPSDYNNAAKGAFAIPAVGSHVWVFFREGNIQFPVYFAASFGKSDWSSIFLSAGDINYPSTYENKITSLSATDSNIAAYRNKYVINQKGGALEFVNTDLNEKVKLNHYSGSFVEMNNQATIELSSKNKNTLVLNDSYSTTKGFKNEYTGKDYDEIVLRDKYKKVGSINEVKFQEWKDIVGPVQEFKQLFEIKRTIDNSVKNSDGITVLKRNSIIQEKQGSHRTNPVTDGTITYPTLNGTANTSPTSLGSGYTSTVNSSTDGIDGMTGTDNSAANATPTGESISPSTQDGSFTVDERKDQIGQLIEAKAEKLTEIEQELGIGGSEIIQIAKHKVETIGLEMNNFGSYRYDPIGKLTSSEVRIQDTAVYLDKEASPLLEYVHVQDLPGGTSTLNVSNRYNVMVGAGGINLKSYGPTNISGSITNVAGEQVNIGSENEINIDANVINISAEILRLRNKRQKQVLVETNLGVQRNVIIGGGLHVEGETYLQHVTAPREYQQTEETVLFGQAVTSCKIGEVTVTWTDPGGTATFDVVGTGGAANSLCMYPHSHAFPNLPLTLVDTNKNVRENASTCQGGMEGLNRIVATPRHNEKK